MLWKHWVGQILMQKTWYVCSIEPYYVLVFCTTFPPPHALPSPCSSALTCSLSLFVTLRSSHSLAQVAAGYSNGDVLFWNPLTRQLQFNCGRREGKVKGLYTFEKESGRYFKRGKRDKGKRKGKKGKGNEGSEGGGGVKEKLEDRIKSKLGWWLLAQTTRG